MRRVALLLFLLMGSSVIAADVEFVHVWPAWRDAELFDRIVEYFGRPEPPTGRETVLRSQPAKRAGYYFLVRLKSAKPVPGAKLELSVIRSDTPDARVYTFPVGAALPAKESVYQVGLTGSDWPQGETANPVAWKIVVASSDGRVLAEHKSFLWEKPAK